MNITNRSAVFCILMLMFWLFSLPTFAAFTISAQGTLPTTVPEFGKVAAYYIISNTTGFNLSGNFIKTLPTNVTQVTCDPKYCGATFNLGASGSGADVCILKLTIKGPVTAIPSDLQVCTAEAISCDETVDLLNVSQIAPIPFVGIASGNYSDHLGGIFPLLVASNDSGTSWSYPSAIFKNLQDSIDSDFVSGILTNAACTASQSKNICIAPGQWCSGSFCENSLPLIAVGTQNTTKWTYPPSVFQDLKTKIEPGFVSGDLKAASCFGEGGNAVCIASGVYYTDTEFFPLMALSSDGGKNWIYPDSIYKNLTASIEPNFKKGYLASASCTKSTCNSVCIAGGNFCNDENCNNQQPLLTLSTDKGQTWSYPSSVFTDLQTKVDPQFKNGFFISSSCTGTGSQARCVAAGSYSNGFSTMPLLVLSKDGGATWTYPPSILDDLANKIGHTFIGALFNAASCTGSGDKVICIAAGSYFRKSGRSIPFLAISRDGGDTWTYPDFIYTKLKKVVDPDFVAGTFDGANCIGSGKAALCTAAGNYCDTQQSCFPLLALSINGGKSWSYPPSVYSNLTSVIDPDFRFGFFSSISCSGVAGNNFCTAAGQYSNTNNETFPLVGYSTDSGQTWTYPQYIYKNLTTTIDPGLAIAAFNKAATSGK